MNQEINKKNKYVVYNYLNSINELLRTKVTDEQALENLLGHYLSSNIEVQVTDPHGQQKGISEHIELFWQPMLLSFPDMEINPYILLGGEYNDMQCVCCAGNFVGTFKRDWFGVPATQQPASIRYHLHCLLKNEKIYAMWYYLDTLGLIKQTGISILPQRGAEIVPPAPATQDGIVLYDTDEAESKKSLTLVNNMLDGLCSYDGKSIESMGQTRFWDIEQMMWYGPSGIGTTRGLVGFQKNHQIPFLTAFPNRGILDRAEQPVMSQIADGNYVCDFGFPSMYATHTGGGWLGLPATNKKITMRVVDIWRRETTSNGDRLKENWVMIDIINILKQFGIDVFEIIKYNS